MYMSCCANPHRHSCGAVRVRVSTITVLGLGRVEGWRVSDLRRRAYTEVEAWERCPSGHTLRGQLPDALPDHCEVQWDGGRRVAYVQV